MRVPCNRKATGWQWVACAGGILGTLSVARADGTWDQAKTAHERGDYAAEVAIVRPLAEKGSAIAQFNLGVLYDRGQGVPQDNTLALQWYRAAAEKGLAQAQVNVGIMYEEGQGVPVDRVQAYFWYSLADRQGDGQAPQAKSDLAKKMTAGQMADAESRVKTFLETHSFTVPPTPAFDAGTTHGGG